MPWQKPKKSLTTSNQVYEFALKLLGNRDYSEQELRSRLLRRGAAPEFCDQVVAKLKNLPPRSLGLALKRALGRAAREERDHIQVCDLPDLSAATRKPMGFTA